MYGPFALDGLLVPDSNKSFDASLKARSGGSWGIRDAAWVAGLADVQGLELTAMTLMPANNFFVVFKKVMMASRRRFGRGSRGVGRASFERASSDYGPPIY